MSASEADLPIVDLNAGGHDANRALREGGFMYLRGHGIDASLIAGAFETSRRFFSMSRAEKDRYAYTDAISPR
jgi:isopenicillin N synthase-like dioxygenase